MVQYIYPNSPKTIEFVMVYGALCTGGIDTLIVRLANFLVKADYKTAVFIAPNGDIQDKLDVNIDVHEYSDLSELLGAAKIKFRAKNFNKTVLVLSFDSSSAAKAELLQIAISGKLKVIHATGIFHPMWYFMPGQPFDRRVLNEWLARSIGANNLFFMNEECRASHAKYWKTDLSTSSVIQLPINHYEPQWSPSTDLPIRVVSVGRLVDFKAYNLGAPHILKKCLDLGINVTWDIYGYGPQEREIRLLVEEFNVEKNIRLMGKLDYDTFGSTVSKYDLFVGMGTAVIESAMFGVPSICATVNERSSSHGYVSELPFGNVGEVIRGGMKYDIGEMICSYASSSSAERSDLSMKGVIAAHKYNFPTFIDALLEMTLTNRPYSRRFLRYVCAKLFYEFTSGITANILFGRGLKRFFIGLFRF